MKDPEIKTYGCRLNFYESEVIRKYAKDNNLKNHIFINSCAVTNKTISDLKNEIRKVKKENQQSQVVLTGCAAQIHKKDFEAMVFKNYRLCRRTPARNRSIGWLARTSKSTTKKLDREI